MPGAKRPSTRACAGLLVTVLVGLLVWTAEMPAGATDPPRWQDLDRRVRPPGAANPMMAYDEARRELVLFGGSGRETVGTWVRREGSWVQLHPDHEPSPRYGAAMVYDPVRQEIVMFGGWAASEGGNRTSDQTWIWNGSDWRLATSTTSPAPRAFSAAAFDRARERLVLFGGLTGDGTGSSEIFGDTWIWDGTEWSELNPEVSPPPRYSAGAAFDAARREIAIFGGGRPFTPDPCEVRDPVANSCVVNVPSNITEEPPSSVLSETWVWDGSTWTERSPEISPSPRTNPALAYDPARNVTVLFGGVHPSSGSSTDTWLWDGSEWTEVHPPDHPSHRFGVAIAGDPDSGRVILFGGHQVTNSARDTWAWDGLNWSILDDPPTPEPRYYAASAYDEERDELLLFGGDGHRRHGDTWVYDGTWQRRDPSSSPPARSGATAAYHSPSRQVVLFAGHSGTDMGDTWVWDGITWRGVTPAVSPPARRHAVMTYDPVRQEVVLFGGADVKSGNECLAACDAVTEFGDTWTWDGTTWTQEQPQTSPPALRNASMIFDLTRGEAVLFGGLDASNEFHDETWTWDGQTWTLEQPDIEPAARSDTAMSYDPLIEKVVLFSGLRPGGGTPDVWLWDGSNWSEAQPAGGPRGRFGGSMVFHPEFGGNLLFGGNGGGPLDDTWLLRLGETVGPSPSPTPTVSPTPTTSPSPVPETTAVEFTDGSARSGQYSDDVLFEARLTDSDGIPLAEEELTFTLVGEDSSRDVTGRTDHDGIVSVVSTLSERPGPYQLSVRYDGSERHESSADAIGFVIDREDSSVSLEVKDRGRDMTLEARLSDLDSPSRGIAGRTIDFYSDSELIGSVETDADGVANVQVPSGHRGANRTYEAKFRGDDFYEGSSAERRGRGGAQPAP